MNVTEETKAHAQEIFDYLTQHPEKHDQDSWYDTKGEANFDDIQEITEDNFCGTTMCVAGTSVWLKGGIALMNEFSDMCELNFQNAGAENLGLDENEAYALFYGAGNSQALDLVAAIAAGDEAKFHDIAVASDNDYI